jgi:hypothetical protein
VTDRPTRPPGGWPPPGRATLEGREVELLPLAVAVSERYFQRYPEDLERYGEPARQWEIHDTQHLLNWAIGDVEGHVELERQVGWLAGVLEARDFPLEHLAGNLELAGDVVAEALGGADALAGRLREAAAHVRGRESFLNR